MIKETKFKTSFSSKISPVISVEKDKYLALASLESLRKYLPEGLDLGRKVDFLPFAGDAFVANRVNANDDGVTSEQAILLAELYPYSFVDVEHKRDRLCGVILTASFSEFGSNKPLTKEEVKNYKSPFNVTLGGIIWRAAYPGIAEAIEESNDPTSDSYMSISLSWEVGFNEYNLLLLDEGKKNIEDGEIISNESDINRLSSKLKSLGGSGRTDNNKRVYRLVTGNIIPLGVGLTLNPAADVEGVAVPTETTTEKETKNLEKNKNKISQSTETVVKKDTIIMKITELAEITDESIKTISASVIHEFVKDELKKASQEYVSEKVKKDEAIEAEKKKFEVLSSNYETTKTELESLKKVLEDLKTSIAEKEAVEKFNVRMTSWDEKYVLSAEDRNVIAEQIKSLTDEQYQSFEKNMTILLKVKAKKPSETQASTITDTSTETTNNAVNNAVNNAIDNGLEDKNSIPNTTSSKETLLTKYAKAFNMESFNFIK